MTVVVAVGVGVGDTDALAEVEGLGVALVDALGDAPGLHDAGAGKDDADGDGTAAADDPVALNVVPKIPAKMRAAAILAIT